MYPVPVIWMSSVVWECKDRSEVPPERTNLGMYFREPELKRLVQGLVQGLVQSSMARSGGSFFTSSPLLIAK